MSSKSAANANAAQVGAQNLSPDPNPNPQDPPVLPCQKKHWIGVRVVDENGKPVKGIQVKLKLSDGTISDITVNKTGSYKTAKVLPPGNCEISHPKFTIRSGSRSNCGEGAVTNPIRRSQSRCLP